MKNYQNRSYTVQAEEMTRLEYNQYRGWQVPENENPDDKGFLVINPNVSERNVKGVDGYVSWLPEQAFAEVYEAEPQTWQGRLLLEYRQLQTRTEKLYQFLSNNPDHEAAAVLREQYRPMREYLDVLKHRVWDMDETTHDLPPALEPINKDVMFIKVNNDAVFALTASHIEFESFLLRYENNSAQITLLFDDEVFATDVHGESKSLAEILLIQKASWKERHGEYWTGEPLLIYRIDEED